MLKLGCDLLSAERVFLEVLYAKGKCVVFHHTTTLKLCLGFSVLVVYLSGVSYVALANMFGHVTTRLLVGTKSRHILA